MGVIARYCDIQHKESQVNIICKKSGVFRRGLISGHAWCLGLDVWFLWREIGTTVYMSVTIAYCCSDIVG